MDMFMDKLAQRMNAQEIIKANTAADTEEMNQMKTQLAAYNDCLKKLRVLIDEGTEKIENTQVNGDEINRLVAESIEKIQSIQQNTTELEDLKMRLEGQLENLNTGVSEKMTASEENVHKECVKVYRNVQAVVVEESVKQKEAIAETAKATEKLKGKINAVLGISIAALIVSLSGLAITIWQHLL